MGDTSYMQLVCKRNDQRVFEDLGFAAERDFGYPEFPGCVEMVDAEANFAHCSDLPTDLVYIGTHGPGYEYGSQSYACDGTTYLEQATDGSDGFVVTFDDAGNPDPKSLADVKSFVEHCNHVKAMLAKTTRPRRKRKTGSKRRQKRSDELEGFAEDVCEVCRAHVGFGLPEFHLRRCDEHADD